jgi:hypothetical protein
MQSRALIQNLGAAKIRKFKDEIRRIDVRPTLFGASFPANILGSEIWLDPPNNALTDHVHRISRDMS